MKAAGYLLVSVGLLIGAYNGWLWYISRDARVRDNADAFVSAFRRDGLCEVRRQLKGPETAMPCADVGRYLHEQNIRSGGTVSIGVSAESSEETLKALTGPIKGEGFKIVGILKVGFVTEPDRPR